MLEWIECSPNIKAGMSINMTPFSPGLHGWLRQITQGHPCIALPRPWDQGRQVTQTGSLSDFNTFPVLREGHSGQCGSVVPGIEAVKWTKEAELREEQGN